MREDRLDQSLEPSCAARGAIGFIRVVVVVVVRVVVIVAADGRLELKLMTIATAVWTIFRQEDGHGALAEGDTRDIECANCCLCESRERR